MKKIGDNHWTISYQSLFISKNYSETTSKGISTETSL